MAGNSKMDWSAASFLSLGPEDEIASANAKNEMFPESAPKNATAEQAKASAHAKLINDSNAALAQLKTGVKVSQFVPILKRVAEFRDNKNDPEVTRFITSLAETCDRVAQTEKDVLFLSESVKFIKNDNAYLLQYQRDGLGRNLLRGCF